MTQRKPARPTHAEQQRGQPPRLGLAGLCSALAGPFDLAVAVGECVAIAGPSGSGKSLLLRMIADLDPNQGDVTLDGQDRRTFTPPAWRRRVVYSAAPNPAGGTTPSRRIFTQAPRATSRTP